MKVFAFKHLRSSTRFTSLHLDLQLDTSSPHKFSPLTRLCTMKSSSSHLVCFLCFLCILSNSPSRAASLSETDENNKVNHNEEIIVKNIDQLLYEMKQFGHEYNVQVENEKINGEKSQQSLAHHLAILRADHTILAQQQQSIIQLIKQLVKQSSDTKAEASNEQDNSHLRLRRVHRRSHINSPSYHLHKVCRMLIQPALYVE